MEDTSMGENTAAQAAIMDNIEDLFGDATDGLQPDGMGVGLPSVPVPSSLVLRLGQMQARGCCTKLTWSNAGCIACVSEDGRKITFRTIIRDQQKGTWSLSDESRHPIQAPEGTKWEHISFNSIGHELAGVDSAGEVHIYVLTGALGKMPPSPMNVPPLDPSQTDLNLVVGLHWLPVFPTDYRIPFISPATKVADRWVTTMRHRDMNEPKIHHAAEIRNAILYISRSATLTLMYPNEVKWAAVSTDLESAETPDELLTHAAMCEEGDRMLLLTLDRARRFKLYRITIAWNPSPGNRAGAPPSTSVSPVLDIAHIAVLENISAQQADVAKLTQLCIIPAVPLVTDLGAHTSPTIVAVFSHAAMTIDPTQPQDGFSVISRWHVESTTSSLHESFNKLKPNAVAATSSPFTTLRREQDVITPKLVLSVDPQYYHLTLAFTASDGTLDFRERTSFASIEANFNSTSVSSLSQCGFDHVAFMSDHAIHAAPSADGSAMVYIKSNGTVAMKTMSLRYGWQPIDDGVSDTKGLIEAAVVCLARQYAILSCSSISNDEILSLWPGDLGAGMRTLFFKEIVKMTNRPVDLSMQDWNRQQVVVIKEPLLPRAIGALFVTEVKPDTSEHTIAWKFAFAFVNLRMAATSLAQLISRPDMTKPEFLHSMRGVVKWAADMLVYITGTITSLRRNTEPNMSAQQAFDRFLVTNKDPAIHLLLNTYTRAYLRFLSTCIPKYLQSIHKIAPMSKSLFERQQLQETFVANMSLPFKYPQFEQLIAEMDTAVRTAYAKNSVSAERRSEIELSLICEPGVPEELKSVLQTLMDSAIPKFSQNTDMSKLYFWDTEWTGLSGMRKASATKLDIIRKLPLPKDAVLRVCKRCGEMMEDIQPEKMRELPAWLVHAQRHCVCTNYWLCY